MLELKSASKDPFGSRYILKHISDLSLTDFALKL